MDGGSIPPSSTVLQKAQLPTREGQVSENSSDVTSLYVCFLA